MKKGLSISSQNKYRLSCEKQTFRYFTNIINVALYFRVQERSLCPFTNYMNVALHRRIQERALCTFTNGTNVTKAIGYDKISFSQCTGLNVIFESSAV